MLVRGRVFKRRLQDSRSCSSSDDARFEEIAAAASNAEEEGVRRADALLACVVPEPGAGPADESLAVTIGSTRVDVLHVTAMPAR